MKLRFGSRLRVARGVLQISRPRRIAALALLFVLGALAPVARAGEPDAHPWLGIELDSSSASSGASKGVRVVHVVRGSPAERSGIQAGDRVLRIAGTPVADGADVVRLVGTHAVGESIAIEVAKGGSDTVVRAVLAVFPSDDERLRMDLVGAPAPAWQDLAAVSGAVPLTVEALRGRVVLVDFWATWCGPCRFLMPGLDALQKRYGAQGLTVLGVSTEPADLVAAFLRKAALGYAIAVDKNAETTRAYGVSSLPTAVIIDKRGVVRRVEVGFQGDEAALLSDAIRPLLAEPAAAPAPAPGDSAARP